MNKIYTILLLFVSHTLVTAVDKTFNDINQMMVSYHNNAFGVDYLFAQRINPDKLNAWLKVGDEVKKYTLTHAKDLFGTGDSVLINALTTIEKANRSLATAIITTYTIQDSTPNLIKMAALFHIIEQKMDNVIKTLKETTFILKRKKKAQQLLSNFALFIQTTAQKANKDTRMGHRKDISLPRTPTRNIPVNRSIPLLPPTDMPPMYVEQEEPPFSPPTRPAPKPFQ